MRYCTALLLLALVLAACAPAPATSSVNGTPNLPASAPTNAPAVVSGDGQTPAQLCAAALPAPSPGNRTFAAPEQVLQPGVDYRAIFCTDVGPIYVDLFEDITPITVNSFVFLAQQGYYNNTTFHRVIQDFMAQGGDPTASGSGGPGYTFQEEFAGFLHYDRPGWLAMARTQQPGSNGSQFFITTAAYASLDYQYTLFGEVLEGQENVRSIRLRDPQTDPNPGTALNTVLIISDPASVATTYVAPTPATRDEVLAAINTVSANVPVEAALDISASAQTRDEALTAAPESVRAAYGAFLDTHNFAYRVTSTMDNATCNLDNAGFMVARYTLDAFATREDAQAALADSFLPTLAAALGTPNASTPATLRGPLYTGASSACDRNASHALTFYRYGRFLITLEVTIPADSSATPDQWLSQLIGILFERALSDVLRREVRAA
ncbi:MAG: peptidylprolyl isomerase [Chloroflexi bacterium]|nr:peptidylprolyl isomerase [Chloroflexota bacterium]